MNRKLIFRLETDKDNNLLLSIVKISSSGGTEWAKPVTLSFDKLSDSSDDAFYLPKEKTINLEAFSNFDEILVSDRLNNETVFTEIFNKKE